MGTERPALALHCGGCGYTNIHEVLTEVAQHKLQVRCSWCLAESEVLFRGDSHDMYQQETRMQDAERSHVSRREAYDRETIRRADAACLLPQPRYINPLDIPDVPLTERDKECLARDPRIQAALAERVQS